MRNAPLNCVNWPAKFSKSRREATIKQLPLLSRDTQVAHQRRYYWRFARIEMIAKLLVAQRFADLFRAICDNGTQLRTLCVSSQNVTPELAGIRRSSRCFLFTRFQQSREVSVLKKIPVMPRSLRAFWKARIPARCPVYAVLESVAKVSSNPAMTLYTMR